MDRWARAAAIATRQLGLITRSEALTAGFSRQQIDRLVSAGRWVRLRRQVFLINGAPRTWTVDVLAHVLSLGQGAVASHGTAAALWGLDGFGPPPVVDVTVSGGCHPGACPGRRVHRARDHHLIRPATRQGVPATDIGRTLLDLCSGHRPAALRALDDARYQRLTTLPALRQCLERHAHSRRPAVGVFRSLLEQRDGGRGPENAFEARLLDLLVAHGLPRPECGVEVVAGGRRYRIDLAYPPPWKVALECDGRRAHLTERAFETDRVRENALKLDGWLVLRFTWRRLQEQPEAVVAEVRRALTTAHPHPQASRISRPAAPGGWRGPGPGASGSAPDGG